MSLPLLFDKMTTFVNLNDKYRTSSNNNYPEEEIC